MEQLKKQPVNCLNHRPILISSEEIFADKFQFGKPIENKCVYQCRACNKITEYTFKLKQAEL